ncbi:MAG TPA: CocE/NonD family hydrolase [Candidatus Thermoplasmatota archaeon]|nr:CocE/NonD family hydrolase [Candidatus Thermoplasmatota archaeon]
MRVLGWTLLLCLPAFAGCLSFLDDEAPDPAVQPADVGYDPATIEVTGFVRETYNVTSFDGTELSTVAYVPQTPDALPDGSAPTWPVVVFLHGWSFFKETYEGTEALTPPAPEQASVLPLPPNRLREFALAGILAVAYDARGFGQSGGMATVAGPAEMADLSAILDDVEARYGSNGFIGLYGNSYGAGQSLLAWAQDPRVTTAVGLHGWVDLYEGLAQGNVPKLEWTTALYAGGMAGSHARIHPMVSDWLRAALSRDPAGLDEVRAALAQRSAGPLMGGVTKPLLLCQGLQESLFPQIDQAWEAADAAFVRAYVFTGGHGADASGCYERALTWFRYFLGGHPTPDVAAWPALVTEDASGERETTFEEFPDAELLTLYLREPELAVAASNATFTVEQNLLANPFLEPSFVWDQVGAPYNPVPSQFRDDPTGVFFTSRAFEGSEVVVGAPVLRLQLAGEAATPFQVTGILFQEDDMGRSRVLSRAAFAALDEGDVADGSVTLRFHWVKAELAPGDRLVLKLDANDPSWWHPLMANYSVAFSGGSSLSVPLFTGDA